MNTIQPETWKQDLPAFREKTAAFYAGELDKAAYKGFSGLYGSYAQKGGKANMLRLRDHKITRVHFTTCQTIQLHDLDGQTAGDIMEAALEAGIVTLGGGGDYPRNVMCSPLSGTEADEYFDVLPWAEAAGEYLMTLIKAEKMPRKLKVGFSSSPKNVTHATYRDLGFAARPDGKFDVYSAGGLGNNPRFGVKTAEAVEPAKILYYIKAMWLTFLAYGNYENRGRARTRYMQETCGGPEGYVRAYREKLEEVLTSGENLELDLHPAALEKTGDGSQVSGPRVLEQKQQGLYTVVWHPIGGQPDPAVLCAVSDAMEKMPGAELRLSPDQTAYLVNLNGAETLTMLDLTRSSARTLFESSVSCIGGTVCQVGIRDSQGLLAACVAAVREADLPDGALPQIHISGCPSSCGTHQTGSLGFRGASKLVDGKPQSAFTLFVDGDGRQGSETMGRELGVMLEARIPAFLVEVGRAAAARGFAAWRETEPAALEEIAAGYLA